jgi:NADPH-dependent curcumin reductase CurA
MITIKEIRESSMKARVAGSKRVHHSELVKDMDRDAMIDYMMKDRNFAKAAAKATVNRKDIYFDDNELVFGDKTVAKFDKKTKVSDMMQKAS